MLLPLPLLLLLSVNKPFGLANANSSITLRAPTVLLAPVYRNVTTDDVWVYPNSSFDLGARSMSCECFDPSKTCCMPASNTIAPFCIGQNTTCCANTYCLAGETCCGDFCCAPNTTCNVKLSGSGCCPIGQICDSVATCYNHASLNCNNSLLAEAGCCPVDVPYCRDFKPNGLGCYASPTLVSSIVSNFGLLKTSIGLGLSGVVAETSNFTAMTVPIMRSSTGMAMQSAATTRTPKAAMTTNVHGSLSSTGSGTNSLTLIGPSPTAMTSSTISSSFRSATTAEASALCHNDDLQKPVPCQAASGSHTSDESSTPPIATNSNIGYSPPGTSVYKSQAPSSRNPFSTVLRLVKRYCAAALIVVAYSRQQAQFQDDQGSPASFDSGSCEVRQI